MDVLAALSQLRVVQDQLAAWEPLLIGAARDRGASWAAIAPALGVASRQAAERRYLRLNPHATDPEGMTGEHIRRLDRGLAQRVSHLGRNALGIPGMAAAPAPAEPGTVITNASHHRSKFFLNPVPVR